MLISAQFLDKVQATDVETLPLDVRTSFAPLQQIQTEEEVSDPLHCKSLRQVSAFLEVFYGLSCSRYSWSIQADY